MNLYLICLILFLTISITYIGFRIYRKHTIEPFQNNYQFLTPKEAYNVIDNNGYFKEINTANLRARLCANTSDCKFKYLKEMMRIDPMEEEAMKWLVDLILEKLKNNKVNLSLFSITFKFAKFSYKLEGNMPHTHADVIYIPSYFYEELWELYQKYKNKNSNTEINYIIRKYGGTLIHELCHVLQRKYTSFFNKIYTKDWNFERFEFESLTKCENIKQISRLNPDGIQINWLWKNPYSLKYKQKQEYYLLMAVFKDNHPKFLTDTSNTVYKLDQYMNDKYRVIGIEKIENNEPLRNFFGPVQNNYHPNEIAAEYLSIYFLNKMGISSEIDISSIYTAYDIFTRSIERLF